MQLHIVRGVPGSGKSSFAEKMMYELPYNHYEADMFFMHAGEYLFDPSKLGAAHKWCQKLTEESLMRGRNVIVSNTFVRAKEFDPYVDIAKSVGVADIYIHDMSKNNFESTHGVPDEKIAQMRANFIGRDEVIAKFKDMGYMGDVHYIYWKAGTIPGEWDTISKITKHLR